MVSMFAHCKYNVSSADFFENATTETKIDTKISCAFLKGTSAGVVPDNRLANLIQRKSEGKITIDRYGISS